MRRGSAKLQNFKHFNADRNVGYRCSPGLECQFLAPMFFLSLPGIRDLEMFWCPFWVQGHFEVIQN